MSASVTQPYGIRYWIHEDKCWNKEEVRWRKMCTECSGRFRRTDQQIFQRLWSKEMLDFFSEVALHWEHRFKHAVNRYNSIFKVQILKITSHICWHIYHGNQAKAGMILKMPQYLIESFWYWGNDEYVHSSWIGRREEWDDPHGGTRAGEEKCG